MWTKVGRFWKERESWMTSMWYTPPPVPHPPFFFAMPVSMLQSSFIGWLQLWWLTVFWDLKARGQRLGQLWPVECRIKIENEESKRGAKFLYINTVQISGSPQGHYAWADINNPANGKKRALTEIWAPAQERIFSFV